MKRVQAISDAAYAARTKLWNNGLNLEPTDELVEEAVRLNEVLEANELTGELRKYSSALRARTKKTIENHKWLMSVVAPLVEQAEFVSTRALAIKESSGLARAQKAIQKNIGMAEAALPDLKGFIESTRELLSVREELALEVNNLHDELIPATKRDADKAAVDLFHLLTSSH